MATMNIIQAVNNALHTEMELDSSVVILGEDVGKFGGVFRATSGLYDTFGAERVIDTPLAESGIIGAAITDVGTPAFARWWIASSRLAGVAARGSIARASLRSRVVTDSATWARPLSAMGAMMSRSRRTNADLVTIIQG